MTRHAQRVRQTTAGYLTPDVSPASGYPPLFPGFRPGHADRETPAARYFTRAMVTVLHSTAATQPERSTASLPLTVMVPE